MFTYRKNKFINYRKFLTLFLFFISSSFLFAQNELWENDTNDKVCQGLWLLPGDIEQDIDQKDLKINFENSKMNFLNQSIEGENLIAAGGGIQLRSDFVSVDVKKEKVFQLHGHSELTTQFINIKSDKVTFKQDSLNGHAKNVNFVIFPWQIHGTAEAVTFKKHNFVLTNVEYSQCPPHMKDWSMSTAKITWDNDSEYLSISKPTLNILGLKTIVLPSIDVTENHGSHKIIALPLLKLSTRRGMSVKFPYLKNLEDSSISITPEISTKYGASAFIEYLDGNKSIKVFGELLSRSKTWDKYVGVSDSLNIDHRDIYIDYSLNYVSNDTSTYRYPDIIPHYKKLIIPNFLSIKKKIDQGYVQLFFEKNKLLEEKKLKDDNNIETPMRLSHFFSGKRFNLWQELSLIHQVKGQDFTRYKLKAQYFPLLPTKIQSTFITDNFNNHLLKLKSSLDISNLRNRNGNTKISGHMSFAHEHGSIERVETQYLPMTFSSLLSDNWHNGDDWCAKFAHLLLHHRTEKFLGVDIELATRFALTPTKIDKLDQKYSSVFKDSKDKISALGLKLNILNQLHISSLLANTFDDIISCEIESHFNGYSTEGFVTVFIHNYFPQKNISQTKKVRQLQLGISTKYNAPLEYFFHTSFDLSPTKFNSLQAGIEYDRCCWKQILGFNINKKYSPRSQKRVFEYGLSYKIDLYGLGFMRLGNTKNLKLKKIRKVEMKKPKYYQRYEY